MCSSNHQYLIKIKVKEFVFISLFPHLHYLNLLCVLVFISIYLLINTYKFTNNYKYTYKFKFSNIYKKRFVFIHCLAMTLIAIGTLKRFVKNRLYISQEEINWQEK